MRVNAYLIGFLALLAGCAQLPLAPSVAVMPTPGKPFDLFRAEETSCRRYADQQTGISPQQTVEKNVISGAATGTAIGAAAGGAIGAATGHAGAGAGIGAGAGLITGSAAGARMGYGTSRILQQRYDIAYQQCMYAKGNQISSFPAVYGPPAFPPAPSPPPP